MSLHYIITNYSIAILSFLSIGILHAQTTNTGEMVVAPGTQFSTEQAFVNTEAASFINDGESILYNNLINNGVFDFLSDSEALVRFLSTAPQEISGTATTYFNKVGFENSAAGENDILLNTNIFITREANFIDGVVNSESALGEIIFERDAVAINMSNASFVDGEVSKDGDTDFRFPTGDAAFYRPASISAPAVSSSSFTAKYFLENPDANFPLANKSPEIEEIDANEYWTIVNTSGTDQVLVTLSYDTSTTPASLIANESSLRVMRYDEINQAWVNEGGLVNSSNATVTTVASVTSYGVFTLGRVSFSDTNDNILPDGVIVFNAISTTNDGLNDYLSITELEKLPNNTIEIFNRWGALIYKTSDYDTRGNVFRGFTESQNAFFNTESLPSATYFYVLSFDDVNQPGERLKKVGYLYVDSD